MIMKPTEQKARECITELCDTGIVRNSDYGDAKEIILHHFADEPSINRRICPKCKKETVIADGYCFGQCREITMQPTEWFNKAASQTNEYAAQLHDKERLDWLDKCNVGVAVEEYNTNNMSFRQAIDAAQRKESK